MTEPVASRPHMPGYGIDTSADGLLPWAHAVDRLTTSHDYWLATVGASGHPAVTPVWGVWHDDALWFSCSPSSRKARNLERDPRITATTDNALEPVIVEGRAERIVDTTSVEAYTAWANAKYETDYAVDFYAENWLGRVQPSWVFALVEADFATSPTRWRFAPSGHAD